MNWIEIVSLMASFASLAAFSLFLYFSLTLRRQKKELSRRIVTQEGGEVGLSKRPIAMAIGIGKDLEASVSNYLKDHDWGDVPLFSWKSGGNWLEPKDYPEAMVKINELKDLALKGGVTEVLLFYAGPIDLAIYIGSRLQNWVPVKVFNFEKGTYRHNLTLEKESAGMEPLTEQLVKKL
jgi:hypothetical protein